MCFEGCESLADEKSSIFPPLLQSGFTRGKGILSFKMPMGGDTTFYSNNVIPCSVQVQDNM